MSSNPNDLGRKCYITQENVRILIQQQITHELEYLEH